LAYGCTRSNAIRGYGWSPLSALVIAYEVSTMNILWGKTWDRSVLDCFFGGIFSEMPDQNLIILHTYNYPAHLIVLDAKTGSFKVAIRYLNSINNHADGRFMIAKF
jgi:hypothetical protein